MAEVPVPWDESKVGQEDCRLLLPLTRPQSHGSSPYCHRYFTKDTINPPSFVTRQLVRSSYRAILDAVYHGFVVDPDTRSPNKSVYVEPEAAIKNGCTILERIAKISQLLVLACRVPGQRLQAPIQWGNDDTTKLMEYWLIRWEPQSTP